MKKNELVATGIVLIAFSMLLIYNHLTSGGDYATAVISAIIGFAGTICLYHQRSINIDTFIFSSGFYIGGGVILPIIPMLEGYAPYLTAICYIGAVLMIFFPPRERTSVQGAAHH